MKIETLLSVWNKFWYQESSSKNLGLQRILFFAIVFNYMYHRDLQSHALFPSSFYTPNSLFSLLNLAAPDPSTFFRLLLLWKISLFFSLIGFLSKLSMLSSVVLGSYVLGMRFNYGFTHWDSAVIPIVNFVLLCSPCCHAFSVDSLLFKTKRSKANYYWPMKLIQVLWAIIFLSAAFAKLKNSGIEWVLNPQLGNYVLKNQYEYNFMFNSESKNFFSDVFIHAPNFLMVTASLFSLCLELSAPLAVLKQNLAKFIVPMIFGMQVLIAITLFQNFLLTYVGLYLFWFKPYERLKALLKFSTGTYRKFRG